MDEWKVCQRNSTWKLFNIVDDIGEKNVLSEDYPERLRQMVAEVADFCESHTEPQWFDNEQKAKEWKEKGMPNHDKTFRVD